MAGRWLRAAESINRIEPLTERTSIILQPGYIAMIDDRTITIPAAAPARAVVPAPEQGVSRRIPAASPGADHGWLGAISGATAQTLRQAPGCEPAHNLRHFRTRAALERQMDIARQLRSEFVISGARRMLSALGRLWAASGRAKL